MDLLKKYWEMVNGDPKWFHKIRVAYLESHRYYHSLSHIYSLLKELEEYLKKNTLSITDFHTIVYAIFFHDIIYDPKSDRNEEDSDLLWQEYCKGMNLDPSRVSKFILATKNHFSNNDPILDLFLDLDLSILGSDKEEFEQYERDVRKEFIFVPDDLYIQARKQILNSLVKNPYKTEWAKNRYLKNLKRNFK